MAIQTTRWSPDTCSCVHDYQWDDSIPAEQRIHTAGAAIAQCSFHKGLSVAANFAVLQDENPRKNRALATILSQAANVLLDDITWFFDSTRVLNVSCSKLTTAQKTAAQRAVDTVFGPGKVLIS